MDAPFCQAEIGYFWLQKAYGRVPWDAWIKVG